MSNNLPSSYRYFTLPSGREVGVFTPLEMLDGVAHAVTTKRGPVFPVDAAAGESLYCDLAFEMNCTEVAWCHQVHGGRVLAVDDGGCAGEADGLATDCPDLLLLARSADCPLVLLAAGDGSAVGLAHASWRSTVAGVSRTLVETLAERFGCDRREMVACIAPSAGPERYVVGSEVRAAAIEALGAEAGYHFSHADRQPGRYLFDLWSANASQLMAAGVDFMNVYVSQVCTITHPERYPSYRVEGQAAGRFVAAIARR